MKYMRQSITFLFVEDLFSKGAQGIAFIMQEVLLIKKFLQTISQVKRRIKKIFDLLYAVT